MSAYRNFFLLLLLCSIIANAEFARTSLIEKIKQTNINGPTNFETLNEQVTRKKKNYILCDVSEKLKNSCFSESLDFTFSAIFHDKNLNKLSVLKQLAQTLGEYSTCERKYMKYNPTRSAMEYFKNDEQFLWYEGKHLNDTIRPEVFISQAGVNENRKITFKCNLPKSDVEQSLSPTASDYKSIQSHPSYDAKTTVSAIHIKLNFMHIENINIYMNKYKSNDNDKEDIGAQFATQNLIQRSSEKFLIYYDGKCKNCFTKEPTFKPHESNTLMCSLNQNTCEVNGKCYKNKEIHTLWNYDTDEVVPNTNMFVCNTEFSQTQLYMPCLNNNGGCNSNQTCNFNAKNFQISCQ